MRAVALGADRLPLRWAIGNVLQTGERMRQGTEVGMYRDVIIGTQGFCYDSVVFHFTDLIGTPLPSVEGEASASFVMGYIRFAHFAAGQVLAVFFLARILWAFVGNHHSRQIFYIPVHRKQFWKEVLHEIRWYAFLEREPKMYVGHNPLAQTAMFTGFTLFVAFMIVTGFALYSEGTGIDSWQHELFGWVFAIWPNSQDVHTYHHLGMWALVMFVTVHVYAAIREDIMSRQSIISSMISGERQFRE